MYPTTYRFRGLVGALSGDRIGTVQDETGDPGSSRKYREKND
jgi:hypothetical protein